MNSPIATHHGGSDVYINSLGSVLHIHGTLNEEMILGVNDIDQVNSLFLKNNAEFLDTFIKRRMNNSIGQRKTEHAQKLNRRLPVHTIRLDNKLKREILEKGGVDTKNLNIDKIKKRIFISYNADIFNFKEIIFRHPS